MATLLAGSLLLAPAATWALPARVPPAQDETATRADAGTYQVIAQGISRLPKASVAWTIASGDVPEGAGTEVSAFPLGFAIAGSSSVAILDETGAPVSILDAGEASFLPAGKGGALTSFRDGATSLFQIALVAGEDVAAGNAPGTVVGEPFATPDGRAFEIELARETLTAGGSSAIPIARSGAPTLLLVTEGAVEVASPGGAPVALNAGQFALLLSEVQVSSSGDAAATYLFAAIGDAVNAGDGATDGAVKTKTKTGRATGQAAGAKKTSVNAGGGGGGGGGARPPREITEAPATAEKKPKGERVRGDKKNDGAAATPSPITGGTDTPETAGTPAPVEEIPASPTAPVDEGTVTNDESIVDQDLTPGDGANEDEVVQDTTPGDAAADPDVVQEVTPAPETGSDPPAVDDTSGDGTTEGTTPTEPEQTIPAEEPGVVDPAAVEEAPVEVPAEVAPAADAPVVDDASGADGLPADGGETAAP